MTNVGEDFLQKTEPLRAMVDEALSRYLTARDGCPPRLAQAMHYAVLGPGKRLRPILVLLAAQACDGQLAEAIPAACAVEMVHAYSLVHDDLPAMDNDDWRRGRPTCHRKFGEAMAILAGDALLTLAFEILAKEVQPAEVATRCCAELAEAAGRCCMVGGQADDVDGKIETIEQLEFLHSRKTGALITASVRLGAYTAGATEEQLAALSAYGRAIGLAFQIMDDVLDQIGSKEKLGKTTGKDQQLGKVTFPSLLGVEQSVAIAEQRIQQACNALKCFGDKAQLLVELARFVVERQR